MGLLAAVAILHRATTAMVLLVVRVAVGTLAAYPGPQQFMVAAAAAAAKMQVLAVLVALAVEALEQIQTAA
jgi:hypothetical protein